MSPGCEPDAQLRGGDAKAARPGDREAPEGHQWEQAHADFFCLDDQSVSLALARQTLGQALLEPGTDEQASAKRCHC